MITAGQVTHLAWTVPSVLPVCLSVPPSATCPAIPEDPVCVGVPVSLLLLCSGRRGCGRHRGMFGDGGDVLCLGYNRHC